MDSPVDAVLAEVTCRWTPPEAESDEQLTALVTHRGRGMLIVEADAQQTLPPVGTRMSVTTDTECLKGRLAEHGRGGRFLISIGDRPVRRSQRIRVSLPGTLRTPALKEQIQVEVVDLTSGGARIRGVELPVGSSVTLQFTPPSRQESVSVRAIVAHGTHGGSQPWIGVLFRLVAIRGGR